MFQWGRYTTNQSWDEWDSDTRGAARPRHAKLTDFGLAKAWWAMGMRPRAVVSNASVGISDLSKPWLECMWKHIFNSFQFIHSNSPFVFFLHVFLPSQCAAVMNFRVLALPESRLGVLGHSWKISSGWWFGILLIFPYIGNVIIPIDFHSYVSVG